MKYFVKFIVITFFLLTYTYANADNSQIRFLNLSVILNESKAGKEAQEYLKTSAEKNISKFKKIEETLKEKEKDLITKKSIITLYQLYISLLVSSFNTFICKRFFFQFEYRIYNYIIYTV